MYKIRKENEVFNYKNQRNFKKVNGSIVANAVCVARKNPDICGEWFDDCEVHHLNGNSLDDSPENLIVLSKEDHHKVHRTPVDAFYLSDERAIYMGRFPGIKEASEKLNISIAAISYYCNHKKPISTTWKRWRFSFVKPK